MEDTKKKAQSRKTGPDEEGMVDEEKEPSDRRMNKEVEVDFHCPARVSTSTGNSNRGKQPKNIFVILKKQNLTLMPPVNMARKMPFNEVRTANALLGGIHFDCWIYMLWGSRGNQFSFIEPYEADLDRWDEA